jgi:transcriptional regulator with XRE-family HTH domain
MKGSRLSNQIRAERLRYGLTQEALAARSGVSPVTIARFEGGSGQNLRAGTITRLCEALGLELAASPIGSETTLRRRLARERERSQRTDRRLGHARLAARLLAEPRKDGRRLIARARAVVDRWERDRLCSHHYISRWRENLAGSVERVAKGLVEPDDWTDALFQNTPWSFAFGGSQP